jgi:hypothetical protein
MSRAKPEYNCIGCAIPAQQDLKIHQCMTNGRGVAGDPLKIVLEPEEAEELDIPDGDKEFIPGSEDVRVHVTYEQLEDYIDKGIGDPNSDEVYNVGIVEKTDAQTVGEWIFNAKKVKVDVEREKLVMGDDGWETETETGSLSGSRTCLELSSVNTRTEEYIIEVREAQDERYFPFWYIDPFPSSGDLEDEPDRLKPTFQHNFLGDVELESGVNPAQSTAYFVLSSFFSVFNFLLGRNKDDQEGDEPTFKLFVDAAFATFESGQTDITLSVDEDKIEFQGYRIEERTVAVDSEDPDAGTTVEEYELLRKITATVEDKFYT